MYKLVCEYSGLSFSLLISSWSDQHTNILLSLLVDNLYLILYYLSRVVY